jgi:drug/metabolite transporter (DMT)-like permease
MHCALRRARRASRIGRIDWRGFAMSLWRPHAGASKKGAALSSQAVIAGAQRHAPLQACLLLTAAYLCWTLHDVVIKLLSSGYTLAQVLFFGRVVSLPIAAVMAHRNGGFATLRPVRPWQHVMRGGVSIVEMFCFVGAIALAPLADMFTITFAAPFIMTILSVIFLGERVGWRRWTAVLAGFLGVFIVLQPSGAGYGFASMLAIGSAIGYAVFLVMTREMTRTESVPGMVFWNSLMVMIVTAILMIPGWKTPTGIDIWWFAAIAVTGAIGQLLVTEAFRLGEASLLAPLQYTSLIWAAIFGYWIFGDVPTPTLWAGAAVIIAAALYVVHRESRQRP